MASERDTNENRLLADRLRGLDQQTLTAAREAGRQVAGQVGKMQNVSQSSGPTASPNLTRDQDAPSSAARYRHIQEKQQQELKGGAPGQKAVESAPGLQQTAKTPDQEKPVASVAKDKNLAEVAKSLRESGVTAGRPANDIARPTQTPEAAQKQSRGRGR
jgi:hypothetical protein